MKKVFLFIAILLLVCEISTAQKSVFQVVPLGVTGGLDESNLSAYMVAPVGSDDYVCLDAGTIYAGIEKSIEKGVFHKSVKAVQRENIKGYLISHGHLDHNAGLILNAPEDTNKNIYALPYVVNILRKHYFTWDSWANFTDDGEAPKLGTYHYVNLDTTVETILANTQMSVKPFKLSHVNPYVSTAFLIHYNGDYLLYLGDTGPDKVEQSNCLRNLWQNVGPIIAQNKLKAIFIEVSYSNEQPDKNLFGHLTPHWLMEEMKVLAEVAGKEKMKNLPIVVTHIKPSSDKVLIRNQLQDLNNLGLKFIFPEQGTPLKF